MATQTPEEKDTRKSWEVLRDRLQDRGRISEVDRKNAERRKQLAQLEKQAAERVARDAARRKAEWFEARKQWRTQPEQQQPMPSPFRFPASFSPVLMKLADVLAKFDETTCTCSEMPRFDIVDIIYKLDAGRVPEEVLTFITEEYIVEQEDVREGRAPKFDRYPRLVDVHARVNAVMNIRYELGVIYRKPRKPIKRARL